MNAIGKFAVLLVLTNSAFADPRTETTSESTSSPAVQSLIGRFSALMNDGDGSKCHLPKNYTGFETGLQEGIRGLHYLSGDGTPGCPAFQNLQELACQSFKDPQELRCCHEGFHKASRVLGGTLALNRAEAEEFALGIRESVDDNRLNDVKEHLQVCRDSYEHGKSLGTQMCDTGQCPASPAKALPYFNLFGNDSTSNAPDKLHLGCQRMGYRHARQELITANQCEFAESLLYMTNDRAHAISDQKAPQEGKNASVKRAKSSNPAPAHGTAQ